MLGVTRDAYYKNWNRVESKRELEEKVVELAKNMRHEQPRVGCRKIHREIKPILESAGETIGRDKLFEVLGEYGMHVKTKKKFTKTTYSKHEYAIAPNRIKELEVVRSNQVFVSDITYLRLRSGFAYLFLVTDLYSRKIVGFSLKSSLSQKGALEALAMAVEDVSDTSGIIHHSDRGCQYCCHDFLKELKRLNMLSSMTDEAHCYQNAVAERVNGILKLEFHLDSTFKNTEHTLIAINSAIQIYNTKRRHFSLGLLTPQEVYQPKHFYSHFNNVTAGNSNGSSELSTLWIAPRTTLNNTANCVDGI